MPASRMIPQTLLVRAATATALRPSVAPLATRNHGSPIRPANETASSQMRVLRNAGDRVSALVATFRASRTMVHRLRTQVSG
jgi:hypothetical protein